MVRYSGSVYRRANDLEKQIQRVDIPSYIVTPGDVISFADKSQDPLRIMELLEAAEFKAVLAWLERDLNTKSVRA